MAYLTSTNQQDHTIGHCRAQRHSLYSREELQMTSQQQLHPCSTCTGNQLHPCSRTPSRTPTPSQTRSPTPPAMRTSPTKQTDSEDKWAEAQEELDRWGMRVVEVSKEQGFDEEEARRRMAILEQVRRAAAELYQ